MDLTEVFIGLKRSQNKKMGQLKEKCGLSHQGTLEIGETTAKKASVFSSIKMETSTKVCEQRTKNTVKAPTGETKIAS